MKNKLFILLYSIALTVFTVYVLLDAFVIERVYTVVDDNTSAFEKSEEASQPEDDSKNQAVVTQNSYTDENISINIKEHRVGSTTVYVADVVIKDPSYLKTAFAKDKYGKNIKEKTSEIAEDKNALLAINGDYYSARKGCVLRNGVLYRDFSGDSDDISLIINSDGSFDFVDGDEGNSQELTSKGVSQVISFGPALVENGEICVDTNDEVDKAMRNNPRTAIAWYGDLHYAFIVADGRTNESKGLSLYELAEFSKELGVKHCYNLDGGGSSTMYFQGEVINNPTTNGNRISEREVSDIVYIGY